MLVPKSQFGYFVMHNGTNSVGSGEAIKTWTPEGGAYTTVTLQVSGNLDGSAIFEGSVDGETFSAIIAEDLATGFSTTTALPGLYRIIAVGLRAIRVRVETYNSGALNVVGVATA